MSNLPSFKLEKDSRHLKLCIVNLSYEKLAYFVDMNNVNLNSNTISNPVTLVWDPRVLCGYSEEEGMAQW